jgi:phosphoglycolate phosphatase
MLHYYAKFGFVPLGASDSQHGGARWFDMVLEFKPEIAVQPPVKAVLFDLDGTLVDSVPMLTAAVNRVMRANGCPEFTEAQIAAMVGRGAKALIESVCAAQGIEPTPENVQRFLQAYAAAMMGSGLPEEKFYPGAREAVAALQAAGFKTALVTNKMRMVTETFVQRSGLNADLDVLVAGDDTDHPKPAPDMLLLACEKLGVSPTEAVMVGDSENDAWAAKAAGIRAMLVSTGYNGTVPMTQWAKDNGFSLVFDSVAGIKDYIFACEGKFVS